jgi:hypothetical protein
MAKAVERENPKKFNLHTTEMIKLIIRNMRIKVIPS